MTLHILLFVLGLVGLYLGADWLVRGASSLALRFGIRPMVVGLTIVALATSMPEFLTNFLAALSGEDSLALGNIIGSNIANVALILGVSALVLPMVVQKETLRKEYPLMMASLVAFYLMALDGVISRLDGALLVIGLFGFMAFVLIDARRHTRRTSALEGVPVEADVKSKPALPQVLYVIAGMVFLSLGAYWMVEAAVFMAAVAGISPAVVGLTVVAVGTSLPELAASVVAARKAEGDLSLGNVLGSNLLNVLFVVGIVSLIRPLHVEPEAIDLHLPVMLAFALLLLPLVATKLRLDRWEGAVLLACFIGYTVYLLLPYV